MLTEHVMANFYQSVAIYICGNTYLTESGCVIISLPLLSIDSTVDDTGTFNQMSVRVRKLALFINCHLLLFFTSSIYHTFDYTELLSFTQQTVVWNVTIALLGGWLNAS